MSVPDAGPSTPTTSLVAADGTQSSNLVVKPAHAAKTAMANPWAGLKDTLQLLARSQDAFSPLKSAVAGFLSVVDVFEVRHLVSYIFVWRLLSSECL